MARGAAAGARVAGRSQTVTAFIRPSVVVERAEMYKALIDLVIGMTGRTERYACFEVTGREVAIRLADNEYDARHGAG